MATRRDEQCAAHRREPDDNTLARAQAALSDALTELRRLTQDPFFDRVGSLVADLVNAPASSDVDLDTVHKLRDMSAEHQRVVIELETAARCCRLVEREINKRADALLARRGGELSAALGHQPDAQAAITRRRNGLDGWLGELFRRGRGGPRHSEEGRTPVTHEHPDPLTGPPTAPMALYPGPPALVAPYPASRALMPLADLAHPPPALPMALTASYAELATPVPPADIAALALGPLEVHVAGQVVPRWNSLKARAVFQYLLINQNRPTRRDVLMALQWPDHSHNSARNNLNVALYSLRNTLAGLGHSAHPILYRDGCYILNPGLTWWIDRNEFLSALDDARLARRTDRPRQAIGAYHKAVRLYRGPLFEDDVAGEWYLPEQRHLQELYVQALEHVAELHFRLGELPEAVRFGQLAVSNDPCCEPMHRMLMRCYASGHQQQLVSRQYRACVSSLHDELGVPPGDETVQLFHKLTAARQAGFLSAE
jgi:DNA-binding SARP family transcriptional activator